MTDSEAITIARRVALEEGWPWLAPVRARRYRPWFFGAPRWVVHTNAESFGMNVRVVLDDRKGSVLQKGFNPR